MTYQELVDKIIELEEQERLVEFKLERAKFDAEKVLPKFISRVLGKLRWKDIYIYSSVRNRTLYFQIVNQDKVEYIQFHLGDSQTKNRWEYNTSSHATAEKLDVALKHNDSFLLWYNNVLNYHEYAKRLPKIKNQITACELLLGNNFIKKGIYRCDQYNGIGISPNDLIVIEAKGKKTMMIYNKTKMERHRVTIEKAQDYFDRFKIIGFVEEENNESN